MFSEARIILEDDDHVGSGGYALGGVADAGNLQRGAGGNADFEVTVEIRLDTIRGAGHQDGCADDASVAGINDLTANGRILGKS